MPAKLFELGIEFRIKPIGARDRRAQIINDDGPRDPAQVAERIFQAANERLIRLSPHRLAVTLARMAQHRAKQMRAPALAIFSHPRALAEVHLEFVAQLDFNAAKKQFQYPFELANKPPHRIVTAVELMLGHQVLMNALDGQAQSQRRFDALLPRLTQTVRAGPAQLQRAGSRVAEGF